jgi:hypothetical protein
MTLKIVVLVFVAIFCAAADSISRKIYHQKEGFTWTRKSRKP